MEQRLIEFITYAREKGMDHTTLRLLLHSVGWKEKQIAEAMASEALEMEIPEPPGSGSARDAFLYLLQFTTLYILVIGVIYLYFTYIDRIFPDPVESYSYYSEEYSHSSIRWWLAALIITTPLFFWISHLTNRDVRRNPEKARGGVRRWLTYLTLFVAAMTVLFDVILLLSSFLSGDLVTEFVTQSVVLLAIVSGTFVYYLLTLRVPGEEQS